MDTNGCWDNKYLFIGNEIYITLYTTTSYRTTYKINPNLDITKYIYNAYFEYENNVFGLRGSNFEELYNINTNASQKLDYISLFNYNCFFTVNNEIYFIRNSWTGYYQNTLYTQKLRKEILNGIL